MRVFAGLGLSFSFRIAVLSSVCLNIRLSRYCAKMAKRTKCVAVRGVVRRYVFVIVIYCYIHFIGLDVYVILYILYLYSTYFTSAFIHKLVYLLSSVFGQAKQRQQAKIFIELMIVELCGVVSLTCFNDGWLLR